MARTHCPICTAPLSSPGASRCADPNCSWTEGKRRGVTGNSKPTLETLIDQCAQYLMTVPGEKYPDSLPSNPADAARFWVEKVIGRRGDGPQLVQSRDKDATQVWRWPWGEMVRLLLARFVRADNVMQRLIIAAAEDEVFWRGEPHDVLVATVNETELQRMIGADEYRKHAIGKLREALTGKMAG